MSALIASLTEMETIFLAAMVRSEYGENGNDTWEWAVAPKKIPVNSRPGVMGSLTKKGIIQSSFYDRYNGKDENVLGFRHTVEALEVQAHFVKLRDKA